jgi:hypothetical protein
MMIQRYADDETAEQIRAAIKASDGHCPCVLEQFRCADTKCMCKEFRDAPVGTICNCGLYIKKEA